MGEIIKNRTIRPSSRVGNSPYKVDTSKVGSRDFLIVNVDHETKEFKDTYRFNGTDLDNRDSIHFKVNEFSGNISLEWSGAEPISSANIRKEKENSKPEKNPPEKKGVQQNITNAKTSFAPISKNNTEILILGTMPGEKSLQLEEYYAHSRNKFWKILSTITNEPIPGEYSEKLELLQKTKVGIWDVAHSAYRKGSLDSNIQNEVPNDVPGFIKKHPNLKVIAFNGPKAESLFDKYFERNSDLTYVSLPSSSPANTGFTFEALSSRWEKILK